MALRSVRGIVFDLWNTLAYTDYQPHPLEVLAAAFDLVSDPGWRRVLENAIMTRRLLGIGDALDAIAKATGRRFTGRWSRRDLILLWNEAATRNRLFSDVLPALEALSRPGRGRDRYRLGILSNTQSFDLDFLRREGLEGLMDVVVLSCDCGLLKPDRAVYELAASRIGLPPGQLLMVGDSRPDDVHGPREAGFQSILLDRAGTAPGSLMNRVWRVGSPSAFGRRIIPAGGVGASTDFHLTTLAELRGILNSS